MANYYGWKPDSPDFRDYKFEARQDILTSLPDRVDLRPKTPPVVNQGSLGSCTANAVGVAHRFAQRNQGQKDWMPSRLFVYYNTRVLDGSNVNQDTGSSIRNAIKSVGKQGVCSEASWQYNIAKFAVKPPLSTYEEALNNQAITYQSVQQTLSQLQGCLASGFPIAMGFTVFSSFESDHVARTGIMPMPSSGEKVLGGHAVLFVGYDNNRGCFIVRNSWGTGWGDKGDFYMPYGFATSRNYASDFWAITQVEVNVAPNPTPTPVPPTPQALKKVCTLNGVPIYVPADTIVS